MNIIIIYSHFNLVDAFRYLHNRNRKLSSVKVTYVVYLISVAARQRQYHKFYIIMLLSDFISTFPSFKCRVTLYDGNCNKGH